MTNSFTHPVPASGATDESSGPIVVVDDLRYRYPRRERLALDGVSFAIGRGEFVGIVGPNGAGKSTLCHALVGLVPRFYKGAVGGKVTVAGLDVHRADAGEVSRRIGLVFQNPFTQITGAKLTVYEEVAFGLEYAGIPRENMAPRIEDALQQLGLWSLRHRNPYALSGGQLQRLAIASMLAMAPDVLVLDEPTSQLDPAGTREVFDAVTRLCDKGMTVVVAEHKVEGLAERAHRILALDGGRLAAQGSPGEVFGGTGVKIALPRPPVTAACRALGWTDSDGGWPVTLQTAAAAGRAFLAAREPTASGPGPAPMDREPTGADPGPIGTDSGPTGAAELGSASTTDDALVVAKDVHFHYAPEEPVLKGIRLRFGPGSTAIVGENGAGKSTFVRLLNGLLKPERGSVFVRGVDTRRTTVAALARTVGLVFQNPSDQLFKSRVLDEVTFGPRNVGLTPEEATIRAREALAKVGLEGAEDRNPYDLGLAERKLVTIAGVLAMGTDVIVLDEPTIAQDEAGVQRIGRVVDGLRDDGRTVIAITHDMDFVARHFQRVVVFHEGRVLADEQPARLFRRRDVLAAAALEAPQIVRLGRELGLPRPPATVDAFVETVGSGLLRT